MCRRSLMFAVTMFLVVGVCASGWAQMEEGDEADLAAIREIWNQYDTTRGAGDLGAWISLWSEDGIRMAPDVPAVFGKEQIRTSVEPGFDLFAIDMTVTPEEIRVPGDWAFSRGTYTFTRTPKEGGEAIQGFGKFLTILERQADGAWKIAIDCFNLDGPPQPAAKVAGTSWVQELQVQTEDVEADIAAVKEVHSQYGAAVIAGDIDVWVSVWSDDGIRLKPDSPAIFGKEEIRASVEPGFGLFDMDMTIEFGDVRVAGDWAYARGPYTHTLTPKAGGRPHGLLESTYRSSNDKRMVPGR